MSQATVAIPIPAERHGWNRFSGFVADSLAMVGRNLITLRRVPQLLVFSTIQPVIFVLLFVYVFGGAVGNATGLPYIDFLVPGIFAQMSVFGAMGTAIGLATDVKSGLLERFHALPMARSAVLAGRTAADIVRNVFVIMLVSGVSFVIGFRIHTDVLGYLGGIALVLLFGYALSWVFAGVGLAVKDPETAQAAAFPIMAPLVFASTVFVPADLMASWLQPFAEHQPVSVVASAARALMLGTPNEGYILQALLWIVGIIAVSAPIAVRRYRRAV
jgi:ABC-2 type transport system permease protein/oleandomycin transport system permease protein